VTESIDDESGGGLGEPEGHCRDILETMYLFIDEEELTPEHRAQVRQHLDDCIPCLESFEFEAELKQIIKERCKDEVPAHVYDSVRARLTVEIESTIRGSAELKKEE
jgi:mycothiol system anti-sigma-R factor